MPLQTVFTAQSAKKNLVLFKINTGAYGTDTAPGATNAILAGDQKITPMEVAEEERKIERPYFGNAGKIPVSIYSILEFSVELQGSGAVGTAPGWGELLLACGFSETVTPATSVVYTPVSEDIADATIYAYVDQILHKMTGARGSVGVSLDAGTVPKLTFRFLGLWNQAEDAATIPTPDYSKFQVPEAVNFQNTKAFELHNAAPILSKLNFDVACEVNYRNVVNQEGISLTDRKPAGKVTIDMNLLAETDWLGICKSGAYGPMSITHGTTAGKKVKIDAPAAQLGKPTYGDDKGIRTLDMDLTLQPGPLGNDEFTITLL